MKKIIALLLALLMLLPAGVFAQDAAAGADIDLDSLTVTTSTPFSGNFLGEAWGNNTSDADVRLMIQGYNLVEWDADEGGFRFDPTVVSGVIATRSNKNGSKTYDINLADDLYYSDGTKITAKDYVFAMLFTMSPEAAKAGAAKDAGSFINGAEEFKAGKAINVTGIRLYDDYHFSVTVDPDYEPFFYELGYFNYYPVSPDMLMPGLFVKDDGHGAYVSPYTALNVQYYSKNILSKNLTNPSKTSGPYVLKSFDGTTATFEANPYYKGNSKGQKAIVKNVTFTYMPAEEAVAALKEGKVQLVNKVTLAEATAAGTALEEGIEAVTYPRSGLSLASFCCEQDTVNDVNVRRAMAYCMDKEAIVTDYCGGEGQAVSGYYGIGQWMYQMVTGSLPLPADAPAGTSFDLGGLETYSYDLAKAEKTLNDAGWRLNGDGIRHRVIDGKDVKLDLVMVYPEGTKIAESMEKNWVENLAKLGIKLTLKPMPFADLLQLYYSSDRDVDIIYLATDFYTVFEATSMVTSKARNYTGIVSSNLRNKARAMDQTEAGDIVAYLENWVEFQKEYQVQLPAISVYSNNYYDFHTQYLQDYEIGTSRSWVEGLLGATYGELAD